MDNGFTEIFKYMCNVTHVTHGIYVGVVICVEESMQELSKSMRELTSEIRKLRSQLIEMEESLETSPGTDSRDLEEPSYGWQGLSLEVTEVLASADGKISSKQIADAVNADREKFGFGTKTPSASVARTLTDLVSKGLVTRMRVGRETHYALNPARITAIRIIGSNPVKVINQVFSIIEGLPKNEKQKTAAVWYSLRGPEEAPKILKSVTNVPSTKDLCELFGMPNPPKGKISIGGVQGVSLSPVDTSLCVFHLR